MAGAEEAKRGEDGEDAEKGKEEITTTPKTEEGEVRNWAELPRDVIASILWRLGGIEVLTSAQHVCTTWRGVCREPSMWRHVDMRNPGDYGVLDHDGEAAHFEKLTRLAVDLSQGCLEVINIERFGTDDLLCYVAQRSSHLKHLRLVSCYSISDEGLTEVAAKIPLLEELEFSHCSLSKEGLEIIARNCPLLKSFKLNCQGYKCPHFECDEEALVIAKHMSRLIHLQIFGNKLTNDGLQAILDGCPHLESLDLRQCFNLNLDGQLGKICTERIKDLRRPDDPTDDYPFDPAIRNIGSSSEGYPFGYSDSDFWSDYDEYLAYSGHSDDYEDYEDYAVDYYEYGGYVGYNSD